MPSHEPRGSTQNVHETLTHFCSEAYVGIRGSESAKICAYVSTSCHYEKKDVDTRYPSNEKYCDQEAAACLRSAANMLGHGMG